MIIFAIFILLAGITITHRERQKLVKKLNTLQNTKKN